MPFGSVCPKGLFYLLLLFLPRHPKLSERLCKSTALLIHTYIKCVCAIPRIGGFSVKAPHVVVKYYFTSHTHTVDPICVDCTQEKFGGNCLQLSFLYTQVLDLYNLCSYVVLGWDISITCKATHRLFNMKRSHFKNIF